MRRGTTPTYILVADADLSGFDIVVTIRGKDAQADIDGDRLTVETVEEGGVTSTSIEFALTQEETLAFSQPKVYRWDDARNRCKVQIRAINASGLAVASEMADLDVRPILKDGVIAYEE